EELKALRRSLQALPAEALGEDFAARVLRRAERELLAEGPGAEKSKRLEPIAAAEATNLKSETSPASPVEKHVAVVRSSSQADRVSRRGLIWSIIATAAAVGFLIYGPLLNQQNSQVSQL